MNDDGEKTPVEDCDFADRLAELDEALARNGGTPPEMPDRLRRGLAALERLQGLRPSQRPIRSQPSDTPARFGRFRIIKELGRGGFGVVFLAHDPKLHREVALKVPHTAALVDDQLRERFRREAQAAASLNHPNLVSVHEFDEQGPVVALVSAYCPGVTLAEWLRNQPAPVAPTEVARLIADLADGVEHAHSRGVLHRDLKPANILMNVVSGSSDNTPTTITPKITDFGLAKLMDDPGGTTKTGEVLGTPAYMAPEQARGKGAVDTRADVYALGGILYELLVGRPPFCGESDIETLQQVIATDPISPRRLRLKLPRDLETICLKCLEKQPQHRYQTAGELAADLRRFVAGEPIHARPLGAFERTAKWVKRRPAIAGLIAAVIITAVVGSAAVVYQLRQTVAALDQSRIAHEATKAHLYLNQIARAHHEIQANHVGRAERLLDETPDAARGWEWRYLKRKCQTNLFTLRGNGNPVQSVAYSSDNRFLASGSGDWYGGRGGELLVWDALTGQMLRKLGDSEATVYCVAFHPKQSIVAAACADQTVRLWNADTGEMVKELSGHTGRVMTVAFSPDGNRLASGGTDFTIRMWDVATGDPIYTLTNHRSSVWCVAFNSDGSQLVSCDRSGVGHLRDAATGTTIRSFGGVDDYRAAAIRADGTWLGFASYNGTITLFDLTKSAAAPLVHHPNAGPILSLVFTPGGSLAWSSREGDVRISDLRTCKDRYVFRGHDSWAYSVAMNPDGRRLATASEDGTIRICDATEDEPLAKYMSDSAELPGIMFDADGKLLALGGVLQGALHVWDVAAAKPIFSLPKQGMPSAFAGSPDGRLWAWVTPDRILHVRDRPAKSEIWNCPTCGEPATGVSFSADCRYLAWGGADQFIRLCDTATGKEISRLGPHGSAVTGVAFHPDGQRLASAGTDGTFCIWSIADGAVLKRFAEATSEDRSRVEQTAPAKAAIFRLAYSPDGLRLAVSNARRPLEIWDMNAGRVALILDWDAEGVSSATWSADGNRLAIALGKRVKVWDATPRSLDEWRTTTEGRDIEWHRNEAAWGEGRWDWFAANYHLSKLIDAEPNVVSHYARRGRVRALKAEAGHGDFAGAVTDFQRTVELAPDNAGYRNELAIVTLASGDRELYRKVSADMLAQFADNQFAYPCNETAWTCAMGPHAVPDPTKPVELARRALAHDPKSANYLNTLGATLLRAGRFDEARQYLLEAIDARKPETNVWDYLLLAMTLHRLGQTEEARYWFDLAAPIVEATNVHQPPPGDRTTLFWFQRLELRMLYREVAGLLKEPRRQ